MKIDKDIIVAIIIGVLVGAIAAVAVFFLPNLLSKKEAPNPETKETTIVSPSPAASLFLTLENPQDQAIFAENEISVSGRTIPTGLVVIVSAVDEKAVEADQSGYFETKISLEEGANEISITAYNQENEEKTEAVTVFYTEEEI